jgi:hypothetical protein
LSFSYNITRSLIQKSIQDIYNHFIGLLELKGGFHHQAILGKNIDYGMRTLISAPTYNANSWKDTPCTFDHCSMPLSQAISAFIIAIETFIEAWVDSIVLGRTNMYVYDQTEKTIALFDLDPRWKSDFMPEAIHKKIDLFTNTPEYRFRPVTIKFADGVYRPFAFINNDRDITIDSGDMDISTLSNVRYFTWTDVFYIAAEDVTKDKHQITTRFPVTSQHSHYISKINVRATFNTMHMLIGGTMYEYYPVVNLNALPLDIEKLFIDSMEIFSPNILPMGADHDGDQVTVRPLFTHEANTWCDKYLNSLAHVFTNAGTRALGPGDSSSHVFANLLRDPD